MGFVWRCLDRRLKRRGMSPVAAAEDMAREALLIGFLFFLL
jgi:hypothetical protein